MVLIPWALNHPAENLSQHKKYPSSYHEEIQQNGTLLPPPPPFLLVILFSYQHDSTCDITLRVKSS